MGDFLGRSHYVMMWEDDKYTGVESGLNNRESVYNAHSTQAFVVTFMYVFV